MWHKSERMEHQMRLDLSLAGVLVKFANHYTRQGTPDRIAMGGNERIK